MGAPVRRLLVGLIGLLLAVPLAVDATAPVAAAPLPPAAPDAAPALSIGSAYLSQRLDWQPCDFSPYVQSVVDTAPETDCATIVVPMDWRHPDAHPDISLAIALSHATGTSKGLLTLNPGGPGLAALDNPALFAMARPRLFSDYDLLGFDPRGYGASQSAECTTSAAALAALPKVADLRVRNLATHRAEVASAKLAAQACGTNELNRYLGTQQTVDDLEFLRTYLGAHRAASAPSYDKLNYIGYSYGTWLGAWYADSYPTHTGRFLLDSNMNWTSSMYANQRSDSFSFERRRDRMLFPWIARHHKRYNLGTTKATVKRRYETIRAGVLRAFREGRSPVSAEDLDAELLSLLYSDADFPDAAQTMRDYADLAASDQSAAGRRTDRRAAAPTDSASAPVEVDNSQIVRCNDSPYPRAVAPVLKRADADAKTFPFIGYWDTVGPCNYWPFPSTTRSIDLAGAPTILMVQSEGDPATAYEGARAAHRATAMHTRLVSVDDEGQHGLYLTGVSPCVDKIGDAFIFGGRLPSADTTCQARRLTGDKKVYKMKGPVDGYRHSLNAVRPPEVAAPTSSAAATAVVRRLQRRVAEQESRSLLPR
ncbi:alpha/beta hydrolase [uncultured Friedmanniella sp.]|uniref:alpha/beta hydrolase n=1 Tax=uncultured Friedmanniella sp. TaxID=335381 RepID=UPI0035CC8A49